jgi:hypothetical protein
MGAAGSSVAPAVGRRVRRRTATLAVVATALQGGAVAALAGAVAVTPAAAAFVAVYLLNGLRDPFHRELLHEHVTAERRSTMLSAESLVLQVGGLSATLVLPALAATVGIPWAWAVVAVLVTLSALMYVGIPDRPGTAVHDGVAPGVSAPNAR